MGFFIGAIAEDSIIEAAKQKRALAVKACDLEVAGIPYISVIVDGAWCKRSYKTNYNASSGVACIIGMRTKKECVLTMLKTARQK
jgi:hypothetical protein